MTDLIREDATSLNIALLEGLVSPPRRSLSTAWDVVQASPEAARMLLKHLESHPALISNRLSLRAQDVLKAMIVRMEARRVLDEIDNSGDEKMNHDAEPNPTREEGGDAVKLRLKPANPDTGHAPWLVWVPARRVPAEGVFSQS